MAIPTGARPDEQSATNGSTHDVEPVALVGIGCRFPGGANDPAAFWRLLLDAVDAITEVPEDRWLLRALHDPTPLRPGKTYTRRGGFIEHIDQFDPLPFGISPREAVAMDPQQRLILEVAREALEDAGVPVERLAGSRTGVFVGVSTHDYGEILGDAMSRQLPCNAYISLGSGLCIAANRVSHALDLRGPSLAVDTACSSSLVALHLAVESIRRGECDLALVGGVNALLKPESTLGFSYASMLSPDGRCKSFDASANGYARAEGAGAVLLKPLSRARADRDRVYALVLGSAVNQDGHTPGISLPSEPAQKALLRDACARAGVDPADVQFAEAHGTGTPAGDPIEARALGAIYGSARPAGEFCWLGSVKSNIGHLEAGAGIAGLIKAALALYHRHIPPNLHFEKPNPEIDFDGLRLRVPTRLEPWPTPRRGPRLAAVNSFGFGGTNAHAILAEGDSDGSAGTPLPAGARDWLIPLSAHTSEGVQELARRLLTGLDDSAATGPDARLEDIAYTAGVRRSHYPHRLAIVAASREELASHLGAFARGERSPAWSAGRPAGGAAPRLAFVFSGMGPQWWGMGRQLLEGEPVFRRALAECDDLFRPLLGWSVLGEFLQPEESSRVRDPQVAQVRLFCLQVGLAALWRSWGIRPDAVVGHSVGEVAAVHAAGTLSLADAVLVCFHRSRLLRRLRGRGAMLAAGVSAADAERFVAANPGRVWLAAVNSPHAVTLSGEPGPLDAIRRELESTETFCRLVPVDVPYHSALLDPLRDEMLASLRGLAPRQAEHALYSTVTGAAVEGPELVAEYWWRNLRHVVEFAGAVGDMLRSGCAVFLEVGPHPVLAASVLECAAASGDRVNTLASLRRQNPERPALLGSLGRLYTFGIPPDWEQVVPRDGRLVPLPTYPWRRERFWRESVEGRDIRVGRWRRVSPGRYAEQSHPLLGAAVPLAQAGLVWEGELNPVHSQHWLVDHVIQSAVIFPAAGYVDMALAAGRAAFGQGGVTLEAVRIRKPLFLHRDRGEVVQLHLDRGQRSFAIFARQEGGTWVEHAAGRYGAALSAEPASLARDEVLRRCSAELGTEECYARLKAAQLDYGPTFQGIQRIWLGEGEALARIRLPEAVQHEAVEYVCHPALLDACFQVPLGAATIRNEGVHLPVALDQFRLVSAGEPFPTTVWTHSRVIARDAGSVRIDLGVFDDAGRALIELRGLRCQSIAGTREADTLRPDEWLYASRWLQQPLPGLNTPPVPTEILPGTGEILSAVRPEVDRLVKLLDRDRSQRAFRSCQQELLLAYLVEGMGRLGLAWRPGRRQDAEEFGVVPEQRNLLGLVLQYLEASGLLRREGSQWEVAGVPEVRPSGAIWREGLTKVPGHLAELTLLATCWSRLAEMLRGEVQPLNLLYPSGSAGPLESFYQSSQTCRIYYLMAARALQAYLARWPAARTVRVLEVGAGTGGLTAAVLPVLPARSTDYLFTDAAEQATARVKERFADFPFLRTAVLNVEDPPSGPGFEPHSFDVVLAADVLHLTADLRRSLTHLRDLLAPGGLLLLLEFNLGQPFQRGPHGTPQSTEATALAVLPGWWRFTDRDIRSHSPLLPARSWCDLLSELGFAEPDWLSDLPPSEEPPQALIVARGPAATPARPPPIGDTSGRWLLVAGRDELADRLAALLREQGGEVVVVRADSSVDLTQFVQTRPAGQPVWRAVIHVAEPDSPGVPANVAELQAARLGGTRNVLAIVQALAAGEANPPQLWLVTRNLQPVRDGCSLALTQAPTWGLGRVVANEHPELRCRMVDLGSDATPDEVEGLLRELLAADAEDEVALRGHDRYVSRLEPVTPALLAADGRRPPATRRYRLENATPGLLEGLELRSASHRPPGPGEVEVEVVATGLNFKDVAKAMNLLGEQAIDDSLSRRELGLECSGRVAALGEGVEGFRVGQDVIALGAGCFASHLVTPALLVLPKPDRLTYEEAATLPVVFLTVSYALRHLARLRAGERLLVHSATGGVGLAALQFARLLGGEVFATAGSPDRRAFLRALGVEHVADSRSLEFAEEFLERTGGEGVDVVLNTLGGEFLARGLALLRHGGRFVELGKRDLEQNARLGLRPFLKMLSLCTVDLEHLWALWPGLAREFVADALRKIETGELHPLPYRVFPVGRARDAFRTMLNARHLGKIVVCHHDAAPAIPEDGNEGVTFPADATYLISGGLGGFGLATARWLVERGARHLALLGRRGSGTPGAPEAVATLRAAGAEVVVAKADVAEEADLARVLAGVRSALPPLRGVFHAAMVLDDVPLAELTPARLEAVLAPKVDGAWNLHLQTMADPIDTFVLFSSVASVIGNPGQASYVAANLFLDLLAHHRRGQGQPALTVNWGAVADVGAVAERAEVARHLERLGVVPVPAKHLLDALGRLLRLNVTQAAVMRVDWARAARFLPALQASPRLAGVAARPDRNSNGAAVDGSLLRQLLSDKPAARQTRLQSLLCQEIARVTGTAAEKIDVELPLTSLGLDSLMAFELAGRVKESIGYEVPSMTLLSAPSIASLGQQLLQKLLATASVPEIVAGSVPGHETNGEETAGPES
jgi:acyl transferase domain-containing protein/acyl carrier protein/2-polyprenyl-3-methyl-5-hydroxy-6-metoxy-1,4-benzoquinol methylase